MRKTLMAVTLVGGILAATNASAALITAQDIFDKNGGNVSGFNFIPLGGSLGLKTVAGVTGIGVTGGPSGNEIDLGESITMFRSDESVFKAPKEIGLSLLFDGPEFGDVQEIAVLTANFADGSASEVQIQNVFTSAGDLDVNLTKDGAPRNDLLKNVTLANSSTAAQVTTNALFGAKKLFSLQFSGIEGTCGTGTCDNQTDFQLRDIQVPAPASLALFGLGLLGLGFSAFFRRLFMRNVSA